MLPALAESRNGLPVAIASRDPARAAALSARFGVGRVHPAYEDLLADPEVDAVYLPLVNSLHHGWTLRALAAGKHVLCEKPLALDAAQAEEMAAAAQRAGLLLMEGFMYRFHPAMRSFHERLQGRTRSMQASFGFPLREPANYRLRPELGGGALMDVGCYGVSVVRWLLGEPDRVEAIARVEGVDMTVSVLMGFPGGGQASVWGSFESPERQEVVAVTDGEVVQVSEPFTGWRNPDDPYRLMVEAFADTVLSGGPSPLPVEDSIANMRVLDSARKSFGARRDLP